MKIAHLCLANFYIDGRSYQENELVKQHVRQGHDVLVVASTETYDSAGKVSYTEPGNYIGEDGAQVVRLPYRKFLPHILMRKLRICPNVRKQLDEFKPDVILFHGATGWELLTVAKYKRDNPHVEFYVDCHEHPQGSARTFLSREVLHKRYYGPILRRALPDIQKLLCIALEVIDFVEDHYKIPRDKMEFYPLGGYPILDPEYSETRDKKRAELGIENQQILFVQSGNFTERKKLLKSLEVFAATPDANFRLVLCGVFSDEVIREAAEALIAADKRVQFLGWTDADELNEILAAADVYLQPGTQSVTMQNSLCARCAVILNDVKSHSVYMDGNGWLLNEDMPLEKVFSTISQNPKILLGMQDASYNIALKLLDYTKLANRILPKT